MARLSELVDLPKEAWERLQEVLTRFEQALRETDVVALEPFLPSASDPLRAVALRELVKRDLEVCWRKGRRVLVETYLKQFAELEHDRKHLPELLHEEYRIRQKYGDKPPLAGYQVRFPQYFHALEERVQDAFGTLPATRQQEVSP